MTALRRAAVPLLLALVLVVGGGNLWATFLEVHAAQAQQAREQAAQQRQGEVIEAKLCQTLDSITALTPPAGSPAANPSRAYDQQLHATLDRLGPDLGCKEKR